MATTKPELNPTPPNPAAKSTAIAGSALPGPNPSLAPGMYETGTSTRPVMSNVQKNETVQGQLRALLDEGSPLLRQARNRATQFAASRGLQNSSIATQAGEEAFISQALPIASQDASTYAQRAVVNVDTQNRFGLQEREGQINERLQSEGIRLQGDVNSRLQGEQGDIQSRLQKEGGTISSQLQREQGSINSRLQKEMGDINSRLQREQAGFRREELTMEFNHQKVMADKAFQHQQSLVQQDFNNRMKLTEREGQLAMQRLNQQHAQTLAQINANANAQKSVDAANFSRQLTGSYLSSVTARQQQGSAELQQIYATPGLTSAQQAAAAANAYARMNSDIAATGAYYRGTSSWRP